MSVTHRFALSLSGAVSLGSYEAGVLAQLYEDLQTINESSKSQVRLIIDTVAGASAGAITSYLMAQALARKVPPATFRRSLEDLWVRGLDVVSLISPTRDPAQALFTEECMDNLQKLMPTPSATDSGAYDPADVVALWISLTTLDGFPTELTFPRKSGGRTANPVVFYPRAYRDYSPFLISGSGMKYASLSIEDVNTDWDWTDLRDAAWEEAREHAHASASFPIAFRTRTIQRDLTLYPDTWRVLTDSAPATPAAPKEETPRPSRVNLQYVDGGMFNNEPVGRAIDAVTYLNHLDGNRKNDPRTYVVVVPDPDQPPSLGEMLATDAGHTDANGWPPGKAMGKLINAYFYDTIYSDLVAAHKINVKIDELAKAAERTQMNAAQVDAVRAAVGLTDKQTVAVECIPWDVPPANQPRLAGAFAGHFGGFLEREFRQHDFDVGRREAREWLLRWLDLHELTSASAALSPEGLPTPSPQVPSGLNAVPWSRRLRIAQAGSARALVLLNRWLGGAPLLLGSLMGGTVVLALLRRAGLGGRTGGTRRDSGSPRSP